MPSILEKSFVYHNAASHSDPLAFRQRMIEYRKRAQFALCQHVWAPMQYAPDMWEECGLCNVVRAKQ